MISLKDIQPYTGSARYIVSYGGTGIPRFLEEYESSGGLDMDPDFQRGHVWTNDLRTRFIEHLLRGGEHGRTIVWNTPTQDAVAFTDATDRDIPETLVLVDGKQRMTAILGFLRDEVMVFGGNRLRDFDEASRRSIMSATGLLRVQMHVHGLQYRRELLKLYLDLNEGAVAHAPTEIARVRAMLEEASAV